MGDGGWVSAHLFYHDDLDPLLVGLVGPLVGSLAADRVADRYFFLRYWDGGNHLRLRVLPGPGAGAWVRRRIRDECEAFFVRRPARQEHRREDYLAQAARWARRERVPGYLTRLEPNNSVAFLPYRREHHRYGRGAAIEAVEQHFVESSRMALRAVGAGLSPGHRQTAALSAVMLSWLSSPAPPGAAACCPVPPCLPVPAVPPDVPDAEQRYRRHAGTLLRLARRMRAMAAAGTGVAGSGILSQWLHSVAGLRGRLDAGVTGCPGGAGAAGGADGAAGAGADEIVDICAHLLCNRLGVPIPAEQYLRYLAARALAATGPEGRDHAVA